MSTYVTVKVTVEELCLINKLLERDYKQRVYQRNYYKDEKKTNQVRIALPSQPLRLSPCEISQTVTP